MKRRRDPQRMPSDFSHAELRPMIRLLEAHGYARPSIFAAQLASEGYDAAFLEKAIRTGISRGVALPGNYGFVAPKKRARKTRRDPRLVSNKWKQTIRLITPDGAPVAVRIDGHWTDPFGGTFTHAERMDFDAFVADEISMPGLRVVKVRKTRTTRRDPLKFKSSPKMAEAIRMFHSVGSAYAALDIVEEARAAGLRVPNMSTIHQAEYVCELIGKPKRYNAADYLPHRVSSKGYQYHELRDPRRRARHAARRALRPPACSCSAYEFPHRKGSGCCPKRS